MLKSKPWCVSFANIIMSEQTICKSSNLFMLTHWLAFKHNFLRIISPNVSTCCWNVLFGLTYIKVMLQPVLTGLVFVDLWKFFFPKYGMNCAICSKSKAPKWVILLQFLPTFWQILRLMFLLQLNESLTISRPSIRYTTNERMFCEAITLLCKAGDSLGRGKRSRWNISLKYLYNIWHTIWYQDACFPISLSMKTPEPARHIRFVRYYNKCFLLQVCTTYDLRDRHYEEQRTWIGIVH